MKKIFILLILFFNILLYANEKVTLQLKWFHQFQFAGYYAAKEKGFFEKAGLDVKIKQRDLRYNNIEQVINGEAEYGVADSILMLYKAKKQPIVIVSPIFQHSAGVLLTLKENDLNSPYKLSHKDVLFYPNDTDGFALLSMFAKLNINASLLRQREKNDYLKLINKEVDAMPAYLSNEPFYFKQKNIDINIINPANYGFDFYGDILFTNEKESKNHPDRVKRFKEAVLKGWEYALDNKEEMIELIHKKYAKEKSIDHLRYEANVIEQLISKELIPLGTIDEGRLQYTLDLYKEYELSTNKKPLNYFENEKIKDKTFNIYITNWEPFTINNLNSIEGLSIDIWEDIASKANIKFNYIYNKNFVEALKKIKKDENGIILSTSLTKEKEKYGSFTNSYVSFPISIATKVDKDFIINLKELSGKTVAVGKNYTAHTLLKRYYPKIDFVLVHDTKEALDLLANNKVFAADDILPVLNYTMNKYNFSDLKISGTSKFNFDVRFMLNKKNEAIIPVFNTLIESIESDKKQQIINKWIYTKHIKTIDYKYIVWILIVVVIIIGFMYYRQRLLKRNKKIIKIEKQKFESILSLAYDGVHILDKQGNIIEYSQSFPEMLLYGYDEIKDFNLKDWDAVLKEDEIENAIAKLLNKSKVFETKHKRKDGSIIDVQVSAKGIMIHDELYLYASARDITEIKRKEEEIKNYLQLIDENIIASTTDLNGIITYASEAFCNISGYSKEELLGQSHKIIRHPETPASLFKDIWGTISNDKIWKGEIQNRKKNGDIYWVNSTINPIYNENAQKIGYTSVRQDITDKKLIEKISITDGLTNIYNRRHFNDIFPKFISGAKRDNDIVCFLIMDVDHFKQYNDTYGHQMGDQVLIKIAEVLKKSLKRVDDYCFRLGGEEFGLLFKTNTIENAKVFTKSVKESIQALQIEHKNNSASGYITASMGLVIKYSQEIKNIDEIYKEADELLYKSKETGRNKISCNC